jgi:prepilin-type processing-associated H-X9-DG protein
MSFNVGGFANQQGSMVGSNYLVNIIELQNVVTSATGLTPIEQVQQEVTALQTMVDVAQKRIFTNIISKFDQTPIQITDDINLSNSFIFQNGVLFTGGAGTTSGGGITNISSGATSITLTNTTSGLSTAIGFNVGGRTVFSFDGQGRALYYDPSGTGDRFWVSSATLVADSLQVGGSVTPGMVLTAISTTGLTEWKYPSTIRTSQGNSINLSSAGVFFHTGISLAQDAGRIDSNRNWYLGKPSLTGNGDLATSNDFTVIGGRLRYQGGGTPVAGQVLTIADSLGNVVLSNSGGGSLSTFVLGDQIQSGATSVRADGAGQFVTFTQGITELARVTGSGRLGIGTAAPTAPLDVNGNAVIGGTLTVAPGTGGSGYVLTANGVGGVGSWQPNCNLQSGTNQWVVNSAIPAFQGFLNGAEQMRLSTGGGLLGVNGAYSLRVNGTVGASAFASFSPLRFLIGATSTEVGRFTDSGNFGIGTSTPFYKLEVAGSQSNYGALFISTNLTALGNATIGGTVAAGFVSGNGSNLTNIQPVNVGTGSNRLDTFQTTTRTDITSLQVSISSVSTSVFSTLNGYNIAGGLAFFSTLSSIIVTNSNSLSSMIGLGAGAVVSTYSTSVGFAMAAQFSTLSSYIVTNTSQFSTLSSILLTTSIDDRAYASTIAFSTASTLVTVGISSLLSTGGIFTRPLFVSSLLYAGGIRGFSSPFTLGVGPSSLQEFVGGGYTTDIGWRVQLQGDLDISGLLYRNGQLYTVEGQPDVYWARNGSNIWFADGNVGIGLTDPSYPLDIAGRIRCYGVDVIPGPGPLVSTAQGAYLSPWVYQSSNIYYNLGGAGIGTGISSVLSGVAWDVSGPIRIRNGATYMSSLAINIPYGSTMTAAADIFGSLRARSLQIDSTGIFTGAVTAANYFTASDKRLKQDIEPIQHPNDILSSIRGVRFVWKDSLQSDVGCVAQDVLPVLPEAISGDIESGYTVAYHKLVPVLIEALKHLSRRVEDLEKRLGLSR